jgi:hypothetical protein
VHLELLPLVAAAVAPFLLPLLEMGVVEAVEVAHQLLLVEAELLVKAILAALVLLSFLALETNMVQAEVEPEQ